MADHNESPSATEHSFPHEFINTTDAGEEFLFSELPPYSSHDPNAREYNTRNWTPDEDNVEQEDFDYRVTTENEYEENGAASSRFFKDFPKTYHDSHLYAHRRHERVKTRQFAGHYFVKDYLRAIAAKSHRTYPAQTHPAQPHHFKPQPSHPRSARTHSPNIHRYLKAPPAPYLDQVVPLSRAEQPGPSETNVSIVYVAVEQRPKRPNYIRRFNAFSNCVALFFCVPIGILTIYLSYQAKTLWLKGDHRKAKSYYIAVLILNIAGVILGIVLPVVLISLFLS